MADWAVIGIIATIIAVGIAVISIQISIFLYLVRRLGAMQKDIGEVKERVARLEGILIGRLEVGDGALTQTGDD